MPIVYVIEHSHEPVPEIGSESVDNQFLEEHTITLLLTFVGCSIIRAGTGGWRVDKRAECVQSGTNGGYW